MRFGCVSTGTGGGIGAGGCAGGDVEIVPVPVTPPDGNRGEEVDIPSVTGGEGGGEGDAGGGGAWVAM